MSGRGSAGNVIAAVCSFIIPGLGQLVQGRLVSAALHFVLSVILWFIMLGWVVNIFSAFSAAIYKSDN